MKISVLLTLLILPLPVFAQDSDSLKDYYTGEIVVTSSNEAVTKTASTSELNREEINRMDDFQAGGPLKLISGINTTRNSRNEIQIKMRGFDQRQIGVFFDGIPFYVAYDGIFDLSQLSAASVGKITISKSMPSVLYGMNTLGGSVNIISDKPSQGIHTDIKGIYGDTYGGVLKNTGSFRKFNWLIAVNYDKSDGFRLPSSFNPAKNEDGDKRDNSRILQRDIFVRAGYDFSTDNDLSVVASKSYNSKDVPVNIYTSFPRYWRYTTFNNFTLGVISNNRISRGIKLRSSIYTVNNFNILKAYDDNTFSTLLKNSSFNSTYDDYSTGLSFIPEFSFGSILSGRLSVTYKRDTHYEQPSSLQAYKKFAAENYTAGLEKNFAAANNDISAGINYSMLKIINANGSPLRGNISNVSGHIGTGRSIGSSAYLYANLSATNRYPTLKELFSEMLGKYIPNPDLKEEKSLNAETGIRYSNEKTGNINAAVFYSYVKDMIFQIALPGNKNQLQNIPKVLLAGIELNYSKQFSFLKAVLNYTYLYAKNRSDANSDNLEYRPEHTAGVTLSGIYDAGFGWQAEAYYTGSRYAIDGDTRLWRPMPDYVIYNLRISQKIGKKAGVFLRLENIFDKYYETEYGFPQEGRNVKAGVELTF
ncbi:MAG: TonB-dependent receptor [Bacteroidetes bacterium]|nr:TonB-dependent receptor [Bacteroidota bacterium]